MVLFKKKPDHLKTRKDQKPESSAPAMQVGWTIPEPDLIGPGNLGRRPGACR